jgi:hypothetical protein
MRSCRPLAVIATSSTWSATPSGLTRWVGTAQRLGETEQKQRAVAAAASSAVVAQHRQGERRRLLHRPAMGAQQSPQRSLNEAMPRVPGVEAVHFADGGEPPSHRGSASRIHIAGIQSRLHPSIYGPCRAKNHAI